jgi:hypothetical protein
MIGCDVRFCDYCQRSIVTGQRWVREKVYDPLSTKPDAAYRHFHVEVFGGDELSCWEKSEMEREIARTDTTGRNTGKEQAMQLVA